jgi:peptide-methionine (S)-S-oxide reductase
MSGWVRLDARGLVKAWPFTPPSSSLNFSSPEGSTMAERTETAFLAGGCGWIMQALLSQPAGVIFTRNGWMGGEGVDPTEEDPRGHAETVKVVFDPNRLSYRGLLEVFFQVHRADLDARVVGSIYRSEIFYTNEEQRRAAEETIRDVDASGHWPGKTVTKISPEGVFVEEGPEQQDYLQRYPNVLKPPFPRQDDISRNLSSSG